MKVIIMAGGKGTRIQSISSDIPKPMIPINGIPVLETELCSLRNQGFNEFIFTVGHLADCIIDYTYRILLRNDASWQCWCIV